MNRHSEWHVGFVPGSFHVKSSVGHTCHLRNRSGCQWWSDISKVGPMQGIPDQNHCQLKLSGMGRVFLLRHSNVSLKNGKKVETISPVPKKIVQIPVEVPVEQSIASKVVTIRYPHDTYRDT